MHERRWPSGWSGQLKTLGLGGGGHKSSTEHWGSLEEWLMGKSLGLEKWGPQAELALEHSGGSSMEGLQQAHLGSKGGH